MNLPGTIRHPVAGGEAFIKRRVAPAAPMAILWCFKCASSRWCASSG